jgi:hypothetical protein
MDTPITRLRNLMTPIINYFTIAKNKNMSSKMSKIVDIEEQKCIKLIPEIQKIIREIPDDAMTNKHRNNNNMMFNDIHEILYRKFGEYDFVGSSNDQELYIIGERGKGKLIIEWRN